MSGPNIHGVHNHLIPSAAGNPSDFRAFSRRGNSLGVGGSANGGSNTERTTPSVSASISTRISGAANSFQRNCSQCGGRVYTWFQDHSDSIKKCLKIAAIVLIASTFMVGLSTVAPITIGGAIALTAAKTVVSLFASMMVYRAWQNQALMG